MRTYIVNKSDLNHSWSANYLARREDVKKYFSSKSIKGIDTAIEKTYDVKNRITDIDKLNHIDIAIIEKLIKDSNKLKRLMVAMKNE